MAVTSVVLDLDGTLWDSLPWYADLVANHGRDRAGLLQQMRTGTSAATLLRAGGVTRSTFRTSCAAEPCELYPGARSTLTTLNGQGVPLGIVTNLPGWIAQPMMLAHGIGDSVDPDAVATYATTARRKPRADPLLYVLEQLGVVADERAWYVGDSETDLACARAAGVSFAWATWGYSSAPVVGADRDLDEWKDVLTL